MIAFPLLENIAVLIVVSTDSVLLELKLIHSIIPLNLPMLVPCVTENHFSELGLKYQMCLDFPEFGKLNADAHT